MANIFTGDFVLILNCLKTQKVNIMKNADFTEAKIKEQKDIFIATVIHDLKTPLIAQIRSLELLRKGYWGNLNEEQKDILDIISESSLFMKEMLYSLLEAFKIESGFAKLNPEPFDINELIIICINEYKHFANYNNIFISFNNTSLQKNINADKSIIRRIITNLLDNSIKYGYKNTTVYITLAEDEKNIIFSIKNSGYKITNNNKEHIFDMYSSFSELNKKPGIGLGLYYCKKAIDAHNGHIEFISDNNFNEFVVKIPKEFSGKNCLNFA